MHVEEIRLETDWLNTDPVFVNTQTGSISRTISDVIDWGNLEFDPEGMYNYLRFGYIVFGKTPFRHVERLPPHSSATRRMDATGKMVTTVEVNRDPVLDHLDRKSTAEECIHLLKENMRELLNSEKAVGKNLLLPLSGGHDSRMLLSLIPDKSRIQAITYDISLSEEYSFETMHAKMLCRSLGVKWARVVLRKYFGKDIVNKNFALFGPEMSVQPTYHYEMYENVKRVLGSEYVVVSGSVGDWWSGEKLRLPNPDSWMDCLDMFHTLDIAIPPEHIEIKADPSYNESCITPFLPLIKESYGYRTVFSKRGRIGTASFLYRIPDHVFGALTPFYDIDVAMSQISLPAEERQSRIWQKRYFSQIGLGVEAANYAAYSISTNNSLDLMAAHFCNREMERLTPHIFEGVISRSRIEWINRCLDQIAASPFPRFMNVARTTFHEDNSKTNPPASRNGAFFDRICGYLLNSGELIQAVNEWTVLLPIQMSVQRAENPETFR